LKTCRRHVGSSIQQAASWRVSRFIVALKDSASALSAEEPTAPMDWVTPSLRQSLA
jgi:hypothetical protein